MKKLLFFSAFLAALILSVLFIEIMFSKREQQACGHINRKSPFLFWNNYHACERTNILAELQSIRAASNFYISEKGKFPLSLEVLVEHQYLGPFLFEDNPVQFDLEVDNTSLVISGSLAEKGVTVLLRMNGKYAILEGDLLIIEGSDIK